MNLEERFVNGELEAILFTTPTCSYCPAAKDHLSKFDNVTIEDATKNRELAAKYNIMSAPSLVILGDDIEFKVVNKDSIMKL